MNDQDTWAWYTPSAWNGEPLPDGSYIALRSNQYIDDSGDWFSANFWVTTTPWQYIPADVAYDYVSVESRPNEGGCVFRVGVCPRPEGTVPNAPTNYQLITLQTASGNYLGVGPDGNYITASAAQDDALIFCFDLSLGNQQTILWNLSYLYRSKDDLTNDNLFNFWEQAGSPCAGFTITDSVVYPEGTILLLLASGEGNGHLNVFVMSIQNGRRVKDLSDGAFYLVLDGTLHLIPEWTNEEFFAPPQGQWDTPWLSVNDLATISSYPIGAPLDEWIFVAEVGGQFYLIENNTKRLIAGESVFNQFNFNMGNIRKDITAEALAGFPDGPEID